MDGWMRLLAAASCSLLFVVLSLKLPLHPRRADSFRPLLGLDHPVSSIPAATPPRGPPKLPRCTARPAQLRRRIIDWQLFILCVTAVLPCPACFDGGPGQRPTATPIKPSRSGPLPSPGKRRHDQVPSLLGRIETRVTPCACPVLRCTVRLSGCMQYGHDLHMQMQNAYDTLGGTGELGEVRDVSVVSPKFRCRPHKPHTSLAAA